jgi:CTP:molybdopterin cytidylyltransferase MocA
MLKDKVQFKLLIPADVKTWLEQRAEQNLRSQSSELISVLRDQMEFEKETAAEASSPN